MPHKLAIFDLDHTLLSGDSDYLWGQYLVSHRLVDAQAYERENRAFYEDYQKGCLDIHAFQRFSLTPLTRMSVEVRNELLSDFAETIIRPLIAPGTAKLLQKHRELGHMMLIATSTNSLITRPIARMLGIDTLLATEPELINGRPTGKIAGTPCFREGKITRLQAWQDAQTDSILTRWFYSDSINDLPLLESVEYPVAVDPDDSLAAVADKRGWPVISLQQV